MMLIPDYHLQVTLGYQIGFQSVSSGVRNVQKYRVVLGFLKRARAGLRVENHNSVPILIILSQTGQSMVLYLTMKNS